MKVLVGLFAGKRPWGTAAVIRSEKRTYGKPTKPRLGLGAANSPQATISGASDIPPLTDSSRTRARKPVQGHPLSGMPTGTLLRSLLITTISSHRTLLIPALKTLSFLAKPGRTLLFDVDRNPVLHAVLRKTFYDQFCTGETAAETRACVQRLKALGFRGVILTYAKETVFDHLTQSAVEHGKVSGASVGGFDADIEDWKRGTLETSAQIEEGDYLAIKLTGAGRAVTTAFAANELPPRQMRDALDEIAASCKERGIKIIVDAESTHFQRSIDRVTLDLMRRFNRDGTAAIYNTYQAYLKRTPDNIANHLSEAVNDGFTVGLKLVRGAYILSDNRALIHDTKEDTDNAYNRIAQGALKRQIGEFGGGEGPASKPFPSLDLLLASHNKESLFAALRLHQERMRGGLPTVPLSFGQLHGMSDHVSFSLLQAEGEGPEGVPSVFKCSTWGTMGECLAYLLRRAVENRDAVLRTTDEHRAVKSECWRRMRSAFSA
ncbi:proline dehydrogenase [Colletotrichum zoysiae]|uniref:Proline dehydrogenase n=1 Tax=Colletotrichum zoysiae TaxID=1216348 RepID=A0AAD9HFQ3_9PEZI|nr:proline dehydrogenase [Colletotrichum zoysiae]